MYINLREKLHIHLFGEMAYLNSENKYHSDILIDEVETFFISNLLIESNYENLIKNINTRIEDIKLTKNTVDKILNKFNDLFYLDIEQIDLRSQITLTGKKGYYYPISVEISLTNLCKHKCIHCYKGNIDKEEMLDYQYIKKILEYLKGKTKFIQLTGGEPFLHKEFVKIINEYSEYFDITITSSGYILTEELLACLKKVNFVQVSLYSYCANKHNTFVKAKNSFNNIINNILKMKKYDIEVRISTLVTPNNINDLENFIKFCIDMKIQYISVGRISNIGRAAQNKQLFLNKNEAKMVKTKLNKLYEKYKSKIIIFQWEDIDNYICRNNFSCGAGKTKWHIKENGEIIPCSLFDSKYLVMGNIKNAEYMTLIENTEYLNILNNKWKRHSKDIEIEYKNKGIDINQICDRASFKCY